MKMTGNIKKELIDPSVRGMSSGERNHPVRIPYRMIDKMEQSIRDIANVTRADDPFNEVRVGNVIRRRRMAIG